MTNKKLKLLTQKTFDHASLWMSEHYPEKGERRYFKDMTPGGQKTWMEAVRFVIQSVGNCRKPKNQKQPNTAWNNQK